MAFDGIVTAAMVQELRENLLFGKIDKIYQPEANEILINIHTRNGNKKLYATVDSSSASLRLINENLLNPANPLSFCMLLRKHLQSGRIVDISQKDSERIIEISVETMDELGFNVSKKLIFEIMGKHSNIILLDIAKGTVIDSIKRISIDVNRARQILPGIIYNYPPAQEKIPFKTASKVNLDNAGETGKSILSSIGGISPCIADELSHSNDRYALISEIKEKIDSQSYEPIVYLDENCTPVEFSIIPLSAYEDSCTKKIFDTLSEAISFYFENKISSNRTRQKSHDLVKNVEAKLNKHYLKKQKLNEDLLEAENSEDLRLCGELLTANMHMVKSGMKEVTVTNYYDGKDYTIKLDPRFSRNKNAQNYFKRYSKSKTAIKEKKLQLEENQVDIDYLESVLTFLNNTDSVKDIEDLRTELVETGYIRLRGKSNKAPKKKYKVNPIEYKSSDGFTILVGRNNKENDELTFKLAAKTDYWLHTKDIPGSHVIIRSKGGEVSDNAIIEAAGIAAYHSKARDSENVPVDYVPTRYVKKPAGAKPGMVIFTNNKTIWLNPKCPK